MEFTQEQKLYEEVVQKAAENEQFKTELLENPVETIKAFSNGEFEIPAGKRIVVSDQTTNDVLYLNIPQESEEVIAELSSNSFETAKTLANIYKACWEDENFKERLIENPNQTIEEYFEKELSSNKKIVVEDQSDLDTIYLNITNEFQYHDMELTDEELEAVAGGWYVELLWSGICFGSGNSPDDSRSLSVK